MLKSSGSVTPLANIDRQDEIRILTEQVDLSTSQDIVNKLEHAIRQIEKYINPRLVVEVFLLDLPHLNR